jgi:formylglycine-generating enzyme required for sulfatase activity
MMNCHNCGIGDAKGVVPVGSFPPNKFGLYDMLGNVWEWTEDCWHSSYEVRTPEGKLLNAPTDGSAWKDSDCVDHVIRGGSWYNNYNSPGGLHSATRNQLNTVARNYGVGFRVARTLPAGAGAITVAPGVR